MSDSTTDLGRDNIGKLIFKLSTPAIIAQLVNVLYNIIDRIFIGRIENGELAMAGVGVAFPIVILIMAFSSLVGMGGAPLAAIKMGEGDIEGAEKIMSNSFSALIILSFILTISLLVFKEPILWMFGASEATIGYAIDYLGVYLLGTVFVQISLGMNPYINTQGFAKIGMMTVAIGAIINIVLDPIFIFGLGMGVKGAAVATIVAQGVSAIWVMKFLFGKKSILKIRKKFLKLDRRIVLEILGLGVAPFVMQSTESIVLISLNSQLAKYGGDLAVGAMAIMNSVMQIITLPAKGFSQGAQPIISFNYGARQMDRVKKAFKFCLMLSFGYAFILSTSVILMPELFVKMFNNDPALMEIASSSMKIYFVGMTIFGVQIACQNTLLALGQAKISVFLALLRKMILLVPLIFILPRFIEDGLFAVLLAEPISDIVATLVTFTCFTIFYKKALSSKDESIDSKLVENN